MKKDISEKEEKIPSDEQTGPEIEDPKRFSAAKEPDLVETLKGWLKNQDMSIRSMLDHIKEVDQELEGQKINIVFANTINDSSFFQSADPKDQDKTTGKREYCLTEESDLCSFMQKKKNSYLRLYFLMLIGLRVVEVRQSEQYIEELNKYIGWDDEQVMEDVDMPFSEVCSVLSVRSIEIQKQTRSGHIVYEAIGYTEEQVYKIRTAFWKNYVNLRQPLIRWLIQLNDEQQYPSAVLAGKGLADLAQIDFSYLYEWVIFQGDTIHKLSQINCLARIMEYAWKTEKYRGNAQQILKDWMEQIGSKAWIVSLLCSLSEPDMVDQKDMRDCLKRRLDQFFMEQDWAGFLILKVHQERKLCHMIYDALAECFMESRGNTEKEMVCLQFLSLLLSECCLIPKTGAELTLLQVFQEQRRREVQSPMLCWLWRHRGYRNVLESILDQYLERLPEGYGETYLRMFIRMLAFTGERIDFENMEVYLQHSVNYKKLRSKQRLYQWLQGLIKQRMERRR